MTVYCSENTVKCSMLAPLAERLYVKYNDGYPNTAEEIGQPLSILPGGWKKSVTETD